MVYFTGSTHQTPAISQSRVDHFVEVAHNIDRLAALPHGNRVSSAWKSLTISESAALAEYGHDWWRHMATGYSYFPTPSFLPALAHAVDANLSFEHCIRRMKQIARELNALDPTDRGLARDGMVIARTYWRSLM